MTLGGEVDLGDRWALVDARSILFVSINERHLIFFREGDLVSILDANSGKRLLKTRQFTSELGPFIANLFQFRLTLAARSGSRVVPPPAFIYLPYYIDQERGWNQLWNGFTGLGQFASWQDDVIEYHTGLRGGIYYSAKGKSEDAQRLLTEYEGELRVARGVLERALEEHKQLPIPIDIGKYTKEIADLMIELNKQNKMANRLKEKLVHQNASLFDIDNQRSIVRASLRELSDDYNEMIKMPDKVSCPTCGQVHDQDFSERFKIARDEERCVELLAELEQEYSSALEKTQRIESDRSALLLEAERIRLIMENKKEEISFVDLVQEQGERRLRELAADHVSHAIHEVERLKADRENTREQLKKLADPKRAKEIKAYLRDRITTYAIETGVQTPSDKSIDRVKVKILADGSERPRAVLSTFFAYLDTIVRFGDQRGLPIVIDSPLQQEQDRINTDAVLRFLSSHAIPDHQMVVGTVSTYGIAFPGKIIELPDNKYSLLNQKEYAENLETIENVILASLRE